MDKGTKTVTIAVVLILAIFIFGGFEGARAPYQQAYPDG